MGEDALPQQQVIQTGDDTGGDGGPGNGDARFPHRDGLIPQLLREVLPLLGDIDADADDGAVDGGGFGVAGELGKDAADLAAVDDDIIGPFDGGGKPQLLQHLTDGQSRTAGQQAQGGGVAIGAVEVGKVHPLPARRKKAASQTAAAPGLAVGQHYGAGGGALQCKLHPAGIGGVGLLIADDGLSPALRQVLLQQLPRHAVRQGGQAVAQPGDRLDGIARFPQAAGGLPHGGAADPQTGGKLLAGMEPGAILPQLPQ